MLNDTVSEKYIRTCPVCLEEHTEPIFKNGTWRCKLCGELCYSPEYRNEINQLLSIPKHRELLIAFVRGQYSKTNSAVNINPQVIKQVLKIK